MNEIDGRLIELAGGQHQVFSRAQARAAGLSPSALFRRLKSCQLVACGTSALHFAGATLSFRGQLMAGILDLGPDALVGGRSANGAVSSIQSIEPLDRVTIDGLPCSSGTLTVVQLLGECSEREAGNALDSACRRRLTALSVVERRLQLLGRQGRPGVAMFERLRSVGGVESWLERRFVDLIRRAGLAEPVLQRRHRWDNGRVARVDFEFAPLSVIVEVGGRRGYMSFDERRRQEERRNALQLEGKVSYFFSREQVEAKPGYVASTVATALGLKPVSSDRGKRDLAYSFPSLVPIDASAGRRIRPHRRVTRRRLPGDAARK